MTIVATAAVGVGPLAELIDDAGNDRPGYGGTQVGRGRTVIDTSSAEPTP